ncbi:hypothetical protein J3998_03490 [Thiomicrorhabdus sp. 6S2-11]|uniref:DUF4426 domain-containing protein n=1 Tax=Thiomicrorhabdus marina TaxID=2818442 RepID=A0ABS3Q2S5_9GAMM|nr:hypothetical protein [Thiomicrorhabdus marina]MBO1926630.1 hypothetical protein [Thiomicrorhabdus marina]
MEMAVSVASLIVALCALGFTAWQTNTQRKHNRISVKPHLFSLSTSDRNKNIARLQILLINNGLGPAFINEFKVFYKGIESEPHTAVKSALGNLAKNSSLTILGDDYAMPEKDKEVLLSVTFPAKSEDEVTIVANRLDELDLLINYSSAYEKMEPYDSRKK